MQRPNPETVTLSDILSTEGLSYALISNLPGAAVFVVDRNLRYLLAEGEALAIAGFKPEDFVGRTIFEVLPPELAASYEPMYRKALTGEPFEDEHQAHGHTYISRGTPLRSDGGGIYAVLVISYDISERKRVEDERKRTEVALRESEARLQSIANLVPDLLWDSEPNGSTNWYNQRWMEYTGQTFEQAIGWGWTNAIHSDDREGSARRYREAVEQGMPLQQEHRIRRHDGVYRWFVVKASPLKDESGKVIRMYGAATDIHEQRVALEALRESEAKYRTLFNAMEEGFCSVEVVYDEGGQPVDHRVLEANPAFERHIGLTDVQGRLASELMPGVEQCWNTLYARVVATGESERLEQYSSAFDRWFDVEISRVGDESLHRVALIFQDITERKRAEADRIQLIREQSAREQERQRAEALAELDRAKTAFFSNVSHEFRTPLTLSLAPLQDALSDQVHPLDPVQRERLELVHRNSLRLLKLVNTLLDFSRIEAGRRSAVYQPTDLATYTAELASVFRSAIERAGLQLIVDCPPLPEPVFVDREMWEKIVLNLLSNAFKFTFEGEIRVSLYSTDRNQAILQVQDTGTGIAPEHLPHLFERFYQVRGTQARIHDGSGIGLALVHELVQLQGGTIEVSSTLGEGTCFTIALPFGTVHLPSDRLHFEGDRSPVRTLASTAMGAATYVEEAERWLSTQDNRDQTIEKTEEQTVHTADASLPTNTSARVLVVDDNADMREYLTRILSEHVQVEAVADGVTALAAAQEQVPDLILSDVMMPRLDGFELLEALRTEPRTREIPIILLSARAGEEAIVEGLEAGADDYLIKPFSAQELVSRVTAHLQMAQLRGEALQEARSTIRSRDEFISVVSHELNTPLVSILGWTRLLRSSLPNPVMLSKALDTIERNATLQSKLVQDLLDLSRITAGKLRLNPQPIELKTVIETAIATVAQTAADKGIHLTWQKNGTEPVVVMGDSDRLAQVICNLLSNAIKFTPEFGSVTLELSVMNNDGSADASYAEIRVIDTGDGIPVDFLPHVFDRFRQAEGAHSVKGLGLGLAIARHIVELHNGTIHAESAGEGQGAIFIVRLPLLQDSDDLI